MLALLAGKAIAVLLNDVGQPVCDFLGLLRGQAAAALVRGLLARV
jgi:hypothetical protein